MTNLLDEETTIQVGAIAVMYHPSLNNAYVSIWQWDQEHGNQYVLVEMHQMKELIEALQRHHNLHRLMQLQYEKHRKGKADVPPS